MRTNTSRENNQVCINHQREIVLVSEIEGIARERGWKIRLITLYAYVLIVPEERDRRLASIFSTFILAFIQQKTLPCSPNEGK